MSTFHILLIFVIHSCLAAPARQVDNEVVCLYEEWNPPVEKIESTEKLYQLLPRRSSGEKSENNYFLHLYTSECAAGVDHPFFGGAHYQTGPSVLHLASIEYDKVQPQIFDDCLVHHIFHQIFSICYDSNGIASTLFMAQGIWRRTVHYSCLYRSIEIMRISMIGLVFPFWKMIHYRDSFVSSTIIVKHKSFLVWYIHFVEVLPMNIYIVIPYGWTANNYGKDIKFYWYEKNPKYLDTMKPNQVCCAL